MCLPLPCNVGLLLLARDGSFLQAVWFWTYLPILAFAFVAEPLAAILTIAATVRASRRNGRHGVLGVCWLALAVHTATFVWLLSRLHQSVPAPAR